MLPVRVILHPTDFSEHSDQAFRLACSLARDYHAELVVLHVLVHPVVPYGGVMTPPLPDLIDERATAREKLDTIQAPDPAFHLERLLEDGDPATGIIQVAQERKCDLIVMGSHGRRGFGRLLMGSVAEEVVRKAACPVLTVKMPRPGRTVETPAEVPEAAAAATSQR